jgi:hypothetical protein
VVMKGSIFWDITPCSPFKVNPCFGGICHVHIQDRRICQARNEHEAGSKKRSARLAYSSLLKIDVTCSSETSVDLQLTAWHYIQEDTTLLSKWYLHALREKW